MGPRNAARADGPTTAQRDFGAHFAAESRGSLRSRRARFTGSFEKHSREILGCYGQ